MAVAGSEDDAASYTVKLEPGNWLDELALVRGAGWFLTGLQGHPEGLDPDTYRMETQLAEGGYDDVAIAGVAVLYLEGVGEEP